MITLFHPHPRPRPHSNSSSSSSSSSSPSSSSSRLAILTTTTPSSTTTTFISSCLSTNRIPRPSAICRPPPLINTIQSRKPFSSSFIPIYTHTHPDNNKRKKSRSNNNHNPNRSIISAAVAEGGNTEGGNPEGDNPESGDDVTNETDSEAESQSDLEQTEERPVWAPKWLPQFFLDIRNKPWAQLCILLPLYTIHLFLFSTKGYKFKQSIIPNHKNLFQSIGYDSIAGSVVGIIFLFWRRWVVKKTSSTLVAVAAAAKAKAKATETETETTATTSTALVTEEKKTSTTNQTGFFRNLLQVNDPPWKVPRDAKRKIGQTTLLLFVAYLASGYGAVFSEQILYLLAGSGVPLTVATTRAWKVLLGHLMWVYMGINILRRLKPFFPPKGTWLKWKWKQNWLWWAIGGYYVSALFFNIADVINQLILPSSLFEEETVVSKLINPENKDRMAMGIGSIGPCLSAPIFEEVLYRGFLLPALACFLPMWAAIPTSSVLFAIHHLNPTMIIPLSMLGFIWAILYAKSGNLIVTILIHAMWNSRVFLGSLLGLGPFTDFE